MLKFALVGCGGMAIFFGIRGFVVQVSVQENLNPEPRTLDRLNVSIRGHTPLGAD
jgi:hypothetical protein